MREAGTRSALFRFDEVKVVSGALAVADGERVADRLGDVGLGRLHGLAQRLAEREGRGDRRGVGAAAPLGVRRGDVIALADPGELPVVKQVRSAISQQMASLAETAVTPSVFCAVIAVITDIASTPLADIALMSAWIPAPPPESDPAIVSTCFIAIVVWGPVAASPGRAQVLSPSQPRGLGCMLFRSARVPCGATPHYFPCF